MDELLRNTGTFGSLPDSAGTNLDDCSGLLLGARDPDAPTQDPFPTDTDDLADPFGDLIGDEFPDDGAGDDPERLRQALLDPRLTARQLGRLGERAAAAMLRQRSWIILDANWRCRHGELDLVALSNARSIVFVEVKTRRSMLQGAPEEAVDRPKQMNIRHATTEWLQRYGSRIGHVGVRFDVVTCTVRDGEVELHHLEEAF